MKLSNELIIALYFYLLNKDMLYVDTDREEISIHRMVELGRIAYSNAWKNFWERYGNK